MTFIEQTLKPGDPLTEHFIRELHALTVSDLQREGDKTAGAYRTYPVQIAQASHLPPDALQVADYMQELVTFINQPHPDKYDLMKVAIAHHRFGWIHPCGNGNGRVVCLLTYAQLIQYGFSIATAGRVINPTAVFCNDRDKYYETLSLADTRATEGLESWCLYVLSGILEELKKLEKLTQYEYLVKQVFLLTLGHARERALITPLEYGLLEIVVRQQIVKSADFADVIPATRARTYQISKLVDAKMLMPTEPNARQYTVGFANSYLLRGVVAALRAEGFISDALAGGLSMTVAAHLLATTNASLIRYPVAVHSDKNDFKLQFSPEFTEWNVLSSSRSEIINVNSRYSFLLTFGLTVHNVACNTPTMPLNEAHFGGFFVSTASLFCRFCTRLASVLIFSFIPLKRAEHAHCK